MKLERDQRFTIYVLLIYELLDSCSSEFMCNILANEFGLRGWGDDVIKNELPELWAKKPIDAEYSWFNNKNCRNRKERITKRIELLNQCIAETY
jgi:hypothetical protein